MSKLKLFEYWVLKHPTKEEEKDGKDTIILIDVTRKLAKDEKSLGMKIARELPEEEIDNLENIEIGIRPF